MSILDNLEKTIAELEADDWPAGRDFTNEDVLELLKEIATLRSKLNVLSIEVDNAVR
jgi:hypothetical protein